MSYLWSYLSVAALTLTCFLLIFIILLQRGRGGGLAGAFGGAGGQSALGTKAGDVFTKITVGLAVFWVLLACLSIYALRAESEGRIQLDDSAAESAGTVSRPADADPERPAGTATDTAEPEATPADGDAADSEEP
jgi:preprotein translocase subunit SecG